MKTLIRATTQVLILAVVTSACGPIPTQTMRSSSGKSSSNAAGEVPPPPASVTPPEYRSTQSFSRVEFLDVMNRLHEHYKSNEGLQRPNGLSLGGQPDFLGIAAWIFDIYLNARSALWRPEDAWKEVVAEITQSDEWKQKHPGQASLTPVRPYSVFRLDRTEFLQAMRNLDAFYKSSDGLLRSNGLSIDGRPDFEGVAAWIFDIYLNRRLAGAAPESAWRRVVMNIQSSQEWKDKHPGMRPADLPGCVLPDAQSNTSVPRYGAYDLAVDGIETVKQVSRENPGLILDCGSTAFVEKVVQKLRLKDKRWGMNYKRGVKDDPSLDAVAYAYGGNGPFEGSSQVWIFDIIAGHCGDRAAPSFDEVGGVGHWTLDPIDNQCFR